MPNSTLVGAWREFSHYLVEIEARGLLPHREVLEGLEPLSNDSLGPVGEEDPVYHPVVVEER